MSNHSFSNTPPPDWALQPCKPIWQSVYDLVCAPLRMLALPDLTSEQMHLTSLRAERLGRVLPELRGRVLDIGAGDNMLVRLYQERAYNRGLSTADTDASIGADVTDWGTDCVLIKNSTELPFPDCSFDTICYVACINHIPERADALLEAKRLLRPGGRIVVTMIGRIIGKIGHALWWYSEDKHREVDEHEEMGLDRVQMIALFSNAGYRLYSEKGFAYNLNRLYVFEPLDNAV
jgi:SAM-dependent methyltransferase